MRILGSARPRTRSQTPSRAPCGSQARISTVLLGRDPLPFPSRQVPHGNPPALSSFHEGEFFRVTGVGEPGLLSAFPLKSVKSQPYIPARAEERKLWGPGWLHWGSQRQGLKG